MQGVSFQSWQDRGTVWGRQDAEAFIDISSLLIWIFKHIVYKDELADSNWTLYYCIKVIQSIIRHHSIKSVMKEHQLFSPVCVLGGRFYSGVISVSWCTTTLVTDMSGCCSFASFIAWAKACRPGQKWQKKPHQLIFLMSTKNIINK